MRIQFDHIALGVPKVADAMPLVVDLLGGAPDGGGPGPGYWGGQWCFERGGKLEILEPDGSDSSFMQRFVDGPGPGIHHVTFKVESLRGVCERAEGRGYQIVGYNDAYPGWKEAFLHPKQAQGIVVQFAEIDPAHAHEDGWSSDWDAPAGAPDPPRAVRVVGLRLRARTAERARAQWGDICGGEEASELTFCWPDSPLRIAVDIDERAAEGPVCIEVASERPLALPAEAVPALGARFLQLAS